MTDQTFATAGNWALASDGIQWILRKRDLGGKREWHSLSFVRSTKTILARCMLEKGVEPSTADLLLDGLPPTFDEWKSTHAAR